MNTLAPAHINSRTAPSETAPTSKANTLSGDACLPAGIRQIPLRAHTAVERPQSKTDKSSWIGIQKWGDGVPKGPPAQMLINLLVIRRRVRCEHVKKLFLPQRRTKDRERKKC